MAKDSTDSVLKEQISQIYDTLLDLKERTIALGEENHLLKSELAKKSQYIGPIAPHGYYFQAGENDIPLCPTCFQSHPQRVGFMSDRESWNNGIRRRCKLCNNVIYEKEMS